MHVCCRQLMSFSLMSRIAMSEWFYDLTLSREFDDGQAVHEDFPQGGQSLPQKSDRTTIKFIRWIECRSLDDVN